MNATLFEQRAKINERWENIVRDSNGGTRIRVGADCIDLIDGRWKAVDPVFPEPSFPAMPTTRGFEYTIFTDYECWLYLDEAGVLTKQEIVGGAYEAKPGVVPASL
ncbi:MAG TPA: hypothetical protein VFD92_25065 [Candidatus Binatia bacterium]|nr:hypothetical protein [Candidatus Binatia bacterium]